MVLNGGLSDGTQALLMFVAVSLITLNTYLANVPEVPRYVVIVFGGLAAVAVVAKEQFGTRKAAIASEVVKKENTALSGPSL